MMEFGPVDEQIVVRFCSITSLTCVRRSEVTMVTF